MRRVAALAIGDGVAINVGGRRQAARLDRVFCSGNRRAGRGRRIVDRADRDGHRIGIAAAIAVADRVGKAVGAVVVGRRRIGVGAVGVDHHRAMGRIGGLAVGNGIAIDIRGRRQAARLDRVFCSSNRRAGRGRRIVDRADRNCHRVGIAAAIAVADAVGKAVGAVVVGRRRIGVGAVGIDHHRAMGRVAGLAIGDGVAIDVGGRRQAAGPDGIFRRGDRRGGCRWRIVDRRDIDRDGIRIRGTLAVGNGVIEAVGAVVVGRRRVDIGTVVVDRHGTMRRVAALGIDNRIAIGVGSHWQAAGLAAVFGGGDGGARRGRRAVGRIGKVDHDIGARGARDGAGQHAAEGAIAEADAKVADIVRIGVRVGVAGKGQGGGGGAGARDMRRQAGRGIGKGDAGQLRAIAAAETAVGQRDGRAHRKRAVIGARFGEIGGAVAQARGRAVDNRGLAGPGRADTEVEREIGRALQRTRASDIDARFDLEGTHRIVVDLDAIFILGDRAVIGTGR